MFKSATVKLTTIYIGILCVICLLFSSLLYHVLASELDRNNNLRTNFFENRPRFQPFADDPEAIRYLNQQVNSGKQRILLELLYINLSLLITGGVASYFLARHTLRPIEEAHESQMRFTADASHELRTPLATMQTEIEVALRDPKLTLGDSKKLLTSNLEEIATLRQLTTGLLTLARGQNAQDSTISALLRSVVKDAVSRVSQSATEKNIAISTNIPQKLRVRSEKSQLTEIFVILLDNAIKYSAKDRTVKVAAHATDQQAIITVSDQGIGISPTDLSRVFERFFRADNARTQSGKNGHGLGLAIAQQITKQSGGTITLASELGKGTTVTVMLPLAAR